MSLKIGGSKSKSTTDQTQTETLDPALAAARNDYLTQTQNFAATNPYTPTSADQIQSYMNPYTQDVTNQTISDQEKAREMATNNTAAAATAANAFGGSRHGVADAQTNQAYDQDTGSLLAGLNQANYGQALTTAQTENTNAQSWKLQLQNLLNQAVQGLGTYGTTTGNSSSTGSNMGFNAGVSYSTKQGFGG